MICVDIVYIVRYYLLLCLTTFIIIKDNKQDKELPSLLVDSADSRFVCLQTDNSVHNKKTITNSRLDI